MTVEERAEKIMAELMYWQRENGKPISDLKQAIVTQIREAQTEVKKTEACKECLEAPLQRWFCEHFVKQAEKEAVSKQAILAVQSDVNTRKYIRKAIIEGRASMREEAAKVAESECLPKCDTFGHEKLCPVVHPAQAIRAIAVEGK